MPQQQEINKSSPKFRRGVAIERKKNPDLSARVIDLLVAYNLVMHPNMYQGR
jgi:hypothetical protein